MKYTLGLINTQSLPTAIASEQLAIQPIDEQSTQGFDAYIIQPINAPNTLHWLRLLRQHDSSFSAPIYVLGESNPLADMNMPENTQAWLIHLHAIKERRSNFTLRGADNTLEKVLMFLWLDSHRCIQTQQALEKPGGYEYPLLDLWLEASDISASLW
ncbi:MAG: hypothetical protein KAG18_04760, partial [Sinobacterium sp.]|nr:hypothetical protein [Sinobacterium sp.]